MSDNEPFITFVDPQEIPETPVIDTQAVQIPTTPAEAVVLTPEPIHTQAMVRTYHKDLSSVMGQNNPRIMSDILSGARDEESAQQARSAVSPKNKNYIIASVGLLLLGLGVLGFAVYRNYTTLQTLQQSEQLSLIRAEMHTNVTLANNEIFKNRNKVAQAIAIKAPLQTINHIYFTQQSIAGLNRLSFANTVALTGGTIPTELASTLDDNFMYGTYQSDAPLPFLILRVNNYDDAFAGMRAWEPLMIDHLGFLFNLPETLRSNFNKSTFEDRVIANHAVHAVIYHAEQKPNDNSIVQQMELVSTTATSTQALSSVEIPTEAIIPNAITAESTTTPASVIETLPQANPTPIDSAFAYQEGDTILMYTFLNEHTILIATSESVLRETLFRLTNAQLLL